jgi:hypothetical protein
MFKTSKQSLRDWQVTKDGKSHAWIKKLPNGLYETSFRALGVVGGYTFLSHKEAVAFARSAA